MEYTLVILTPTGSRDHRGYNDTCYFPSGWIYFLSLAFPVGKCDPEHLLKYSDAKKSHRPLICVRFMLLPVLLGFTPP